MNAIKASPSRLGRVGREAKKIKKNEIKPDSRVVHEEMGPASIQAPKTQKQKD